ncbi:hypothetical protein M9H77_03541 [Catharanthus roseus]|uniref:Uncharacterized protein n=1 Tax=Catharanthus roseus TaxID=4058 RepID=A0ACC0CBF2_CATRO|nr:hypothetical protein M9H77_03541 [Catharanthus roseus]
MNPLLPWWPSRTRCRLSSSSSMSLRDIYGAKLAEIVESTRCPHIEDNVILSVVSYLPKEGTTKKGQKWLKTECKRQKTMPNGDHEKDLPPEIGQPIAEGLKEANWAILCEKFPPILTSIS